MTRTAGALGAHTPETLNKLYRFIADTPGATRLEMAQHLGLKHKSSAQVYVKMLLAQGRIKYGFRGIVTAVDENKIRVEHRDGFLGIYHLHGIAYIHNYVNGGGTRVYPEREYFTKLDDAGKINDTRLENFNNEPRIVRDIERIVRFYDSVLFH